jgi:hypothetical protein
MTQAVGARVTKRRMDNVHTPREPLTIVNGIESSNHTIVSKDSFPRLT